MTRHTLTLRNPTNLLLEKCVTVTPQDSSLIFIKILMDADFFHLEETNMHTRVFSNTQGKTSLSRTHLSRTGSEYLPLLLALDVVALAEDAAALRGLVAFLEGVLLLEVAVLLVGVTMFHPRNYQIKQPFSSCMRREQTVSRSPIQR